MIFKALDCQAEWDWIDQRCWPIRDQFTTGIVAYDDSGKICAVFVADGFGDEHCGVHLAIDNPFVIRHGFLNECLGYIFGQRGVKRCFGQVPANNAKALKFNTNIGFRQVNRIEDGYATGVDLIIMRMDSHNNRWYQPAQQLKVA